MNWEGYYDKNRFWNHPEWKCLGGERLRKTACFYKNDVNIYFDSSDGVNEDLGIEEGTWRIEKIIEECNGKPFIVFKSSFSKVYSKPLVDLARKNNGDVVPHFLWSFYDGMKGMIQDPLKYEKMQEETEMVYDIGFNASLEPYTYPNPDGGEELIINTRQDLYEKLMNSRFKFFFSAERKSFDEYMKDMFRCKLVLNVPGVGEYTGRILEACMMEKAIVSRKNTYDNALGYKHHFAEVDFNADDWEDQLQKILDEYKHWEYMSATYWHVVYAGNGQQEYVEDVLKSI